MTWTSDKIGHCNLHYDSRRRLNTTAIQLRQPIRAAKNADKNFKVMLIFLLIVLIYILLISIQITLVLFPSSVPGQPGKFKIGRVTDTSIELTWEPAYTKEGIINYELLYKPVKYGSLVRESTENITTTWGARKQILKLFFLIGVKKYV